jgi:hypothetical protein
VSDKAIAAANEAVKDKLESNVFNHDKHYRGLVAWIKSRNKKKSRDAMALMLGEMMAEGSTVAYALWGLYDVEDWPSPAEEYANKAISAAASELTTKLSAAEADATKWEGHYRDCLELLTSSGNAVGELTAKLANAQAALYEFGSHKSSCASVSLGVRMGECPPQKCTCGLESITTTTSTRLANYEAALRVTLEICEDGDTGASLSRVANAMNVASEAIAGGTAALDSIRAEGRRTIEGLTAALQNMLSLAGMFHSFACCGEAVSITDEETFSEVVSMAKEALSGSTADLQDHDAPLLNLLAVIHRDGGQHTCEVGAKQSAADAEKIVVRLREELEQIAANARREAYQEAAKKCCYDNSAKLDLYLFTAEDYNRIRDWLNRMADASDQTADSKGETE